MNEDFERYWSLIERSGNMKVTKEEARRVWDIAYPKPRPGQTVDWDRPHTLGVEDLRELQRLIGSTISLLDHGRPGMITSVWSKTAPFDAILGGKWGIKKLKP